MTIRQKVAVMILRELDKKAWRETVLASIDNASREDRIKELVAFGMIGRHTHRNPKKGIPKRKEEGIHEE